MNRDILKKYDNDFFKIMSENFGDEIFVTDGEGIILFLNPASAKDINATPQDVIGRYVGDVVDEGYFYPSVSIEVIRQKKPVNIIQTLYDGTKVLCTGVPVFDDNHDVIKMVVSTTKKVDEINEMMDRMELQEHEISNLRNIALEEEGYISGAKDTYGIKNKIVKTAPLDIPILIQGETGVGKEVVARAIHRFRFGKDKPMVKINCATIPEHLMESELFGYEKGAFTGADGAGKRGKVELSEGGTLFLDEIGEMPLNLQVKLLDFIQDGTFMRVGGNEMKTVKTRIIVATNRDLKKMCDEGEFRKDLFYRINVVPFNIPPLRERPEDLEALIKHFESKCNYKYGIKKRMSAKALKFLHEYSWPGNIRELEHTIEHMHIFSEGKVITEEDAKKTALDTADPKGFEGRLSNGGTVMCKGLMPLKEAKHELEKQLVLRAYEECGSTYKAAQALNIDQSTVSKLLKKYGEQQ